MKRREVIAGSVHNGRNPANTITSHSPKVTADQGAWEFFTEDSDDGHVGGPTHLRFRTGLSERGGLSPTLEFNRHLAVAAKCRRKQQ
jgi:hypothetical protein